MWGNAVAEGAVEGGRNGEHRFVLVRSADDLNADGEALGRLADGNDGRGAGEQVEPLCVTHGVPIADALAVGAPLAFAVAKGGDGGDRREQDGAVADFGDEAFAQKVGLGPGLQQAGCGEGRLCVRGGEEVAEDGAEFVEVAGYGGLVEEGSALHEEGVPEPACEGEARWAEGNDAKALAR